tara:strand:+ start:165 stop:1118 length:954 start_codon:yes stop_codon:yes gene_type:complete
MNLLKNYFLLFICVLTSQNLFSAEKSPFKGEISFTEAEIEFHKDHIQELISTTVQEQKEFTQKFKQVYDDCGVSLLFGFKSKFSKLNLTQKENFISKIAKCAAPPSAQDLMITSCEMHTHRFLGKGFVASNQVRVYEKLMAFYNANQRTGIALGYALKKLGWKVVYWNTDATQKHPTPSDVKKIGATPEDHIYSYYIANKYKTYYHVPVDYLMVNFNPSKNSSVVKNTTDLTDFYKVPYFIGVPHGGFHVFPGYHGWVNESHSPHEPNNPRNIEEGYFNPPYGSPKGLNSIVDGKPSKIYYYSGILLLPPGDWIWFK